MISFRPLIEAVAMLFAAAPQVVAQFSDCEPGSAVSFLDVAGVGTRLTISGDLFLDYYRHAGPETYKVPVGDEGAIQMSLSLGVGGYANGRPVLTPPVFWPDSFWPGPLGEDGSPPDDCGPYDRFYKISVEDIRAFEKSGVPSDDLANWPWGLGAPVVDGDGNLDNYDLFRGDRPAMDGHQSIWWVMNDLGNESPPSWFDSMTIPVGLEIQIMVSGAASDVPAINNASVMRFRMRYPGETPLDSAFVGFWNSIVMGEGDDHVGFDVENEMVYVYNADDFDGGRWGYGERPPAVGFIVLEPIDAQSDGLDNNGDGMADEAGESVGMSKFLTPGSDWSLTYTDVDPWYVDFQNLRGRWWAGGRPRVGGNGYQSSGPPVDFMYTGEPPGFWSEEDTDGQGTASRGGGHRILWSLGPFRMTKARAAEFVIAIVFAQGQDRYDSIRELKRAAKTVRQAWAEGFGYPFPSAPDVAPTLLSPADGASSQPSNPALIWDDPPRSNRFEIQIAVDEGFEDVVESDTSVANRYDASLESDRTYYWRVRSLGPGGAGPWSTPSALTTGERTNAYSGVATVPGCRFCPAFIQVAGPGLEESCSQPGWLPRFGCEELGGPLVYNTYGDAWRWHMTSEGDGPETSLGRYAPHDFEIRFTEAGSIAFHPFTSGLGLRVPWEVWDIGSTGPFSANDPSDDVQLIGGVYSQGGGECDWGFWEYDDPERPYYSFADRMFAFYPAPGQTYADWDERVRPLVESSRDTCADVSDFSHLVDTASVPPIKNLVFWAYDYGYSQLERMPDGVVVRFLTTANELLPPLPSGPVDLGVIDADQAAFWWQAGAGPATYNVRVSRDPSFSTIDYEVEGVNATTISLSGLQPWTRYFWRVRTTNESGLTSDWSDAWSFTTVAYDSEADLRPESLRVLPNYPNPVTRSTTFVVGLPESGTTSFSVYDMLGRRVASVVEGPARRGWHVFSFDASMLASGAYVYRFDQGGQSVSGKLLVIH